MKAATRVGMAPKMCIRDSLKDSRNLGFASFDEFVHIFFEFYQLLGYGGVQGNHGTGAVCFRTYGAELKTVSGEGERTGAVTVGIEMCIRDSCLPH